MTYKEALKEAYKQPWKVGICDSVKTGRKDDCWCRVITIDHPVSFEEDGETRHISAIVSQGEMGVTLAEYIVNLHNKSLEMSAKDGSSRPPCNHHPETCTCRDWDRQPSPPTKTIADLTDEQLFHIAALAVDNMDRIREKETWKVVANNAGTSIQIGNGCKIEVEILPDLEILVSFSGDFGIPANQYQIYEYLRSLNIKPS